MKNIDIKIIAEKIITKKVSQHGHEKKCGRVYVPRNFIGHDVMIILPKKR